MKTFIHTFSISVNITTEEYKKLCCYRWMPMKATYKGKRYISSIIEFCDKGLQICAMERTVEEIKYDKEHYPFRIDLIVTPYKLLYPNKSLGAITDKEELFRALKVLHALVSSIEDTTGIDIRRKYKIRRVDVTCDVMTPSDDYSAEIIAAVKTADLPYGYRRSEPTEEEIELYGWDRKNASLFYNKNQSVYAKVYDKKENIREREEYRELEDKGLIRFEIELTRNYLRHKGLLKKDNLTKCLISVMDCSEELFEKYFVENLYNMPMFSLKVLYDYLELKYKGKNKTIDKLKHFCKLAYKCKKAGVPFSAAQCGMSNKVFANCYEKFSDINISPIPAEADIPYIPSVESMLNGTVENKYSWYAQKKTRGKEVWSI